MAVPRGSYILFTIFANFLTYVYSSSKERSRNNTTSLFIPVIENDAPLIYLYCSRDTECVLCDFFFLG